MKTRNHKNEEYLHLALHGKNDEISFPCAFQIIKCSNRVIHTKV